MTVYEGPEFQLVDEASLQEFQRQGAALLDRPVLIRGALRDWPASKCWTFESLAELRQRNGQQVECRFQDGLVEQGRTRPLPVQSVAPYLKDLARKAETPMPPELALLPESRRRSLVKGDRFRLNWSYLWSFEPNRQYLADWPILEQFPDLRRDLALSSLWPERRWTWEYVFIGPAQTVTGLHQDIHDNWFCQIRGSKELILFPKDQSPHLCASRKYNLGSVLSRVDISKLHLQPDEAARFESARGFYAHAQAGDALFIPKRTWHAVVALEPSISLGVFGLKALEVITAGAWSELKHLVHRARIYRWRNCICHEASADGG